MPGPGVLNPLRKEPRMTEENKNAGKSQKDTRTELGREGTRKLRRLADKAKEKAEKKLRGNKNR